MAFTTCSVATNNIASLDDLPNDVGGLTATQLKEAFDKFGAEFVNWFNATHIVQIDGLAGIGRTTENVKGNTEAINTHKTEVFSYQAAATRDISAEGVQDINLIADRTPKHITIKAFIENEATFSLGSITSNTQRATSQKSSGVMIAGSGLCIDIYPASGGEAYATGVISEGKLTITWAKSGSPTGIATIHVDALYHD